MKKLIRALALALLMMFAAPAATANAPPGDACTTDVCEDVSACITDGGCFDAELVLEEVLPTPAPDIDGYMCRCAVAADTCEVRPAPDGVACNLDLAGGAVRVRATAADVDDCNSGVLEAAGCQASCDDGARQEVMPDGDTRVTTLRIRLDLQRPAWAGRCGLVPRS